MISWSSKRVLNFVVICFQHVLFNLLFEHFLPSIDSNFYSIFVIISSKLNYMFENSYVVNARRNCFVPPPPQLIVAKSQLSHNKLFIKIASCVGFISLLGKDCESDSSSVGEEQFA